MAFANLLRFCAPGPQIAGVEEIDAAGRTGRLYWPEARSTTAMVFLHGGGLVAGSLDTPDALCRTLAAASGCNVFTVDYRLAPEHPFPAAFDDTLAALEWIFERASAYGVERIGGRRRFGRRDTGPPPLPPNGGGRRSRTWPSSFCFVPFSISPARRCRAMHSHRRFSIKRRSTTISRFIPRVRSVPTIRASLRCVRRISPACRRHFYIRAQCDPLRDEGAAYADKLRAAGVEVHHTCHAGMPHLFYALSGVIPAAKDAVVAIGAGLSAWLATGESRQH